MQQIWTGVASTPDGRLFAVFPRLANPSGPFLAQVGADGSLAPYPDAAWNGMTGPAPVPPAGKEAPPSFAQLAAIRLGPDGMMWAVDSGQPGTGRQPAPGARLIRIDLAHDRVAQVLTLPADVLRPKSMIDDIRFNGDHAYVTDAGSPGLIVLDLDAGSFRRVLDHDPSLTAQRPVVVDGAILKGADGRPAMIHAARLEVSPDGGFLYLQPLCGPMVRIPTALLDDPATPDPTLSAAVSFWYDTPALGGTAIAPDGTLYLDDLETDSILALSPDRVLTRLIHDPRLHWPGMPSLAPDGTLLVPVPQLDRAAPFHHGRAQTQFPVVIYALRPADLAAGSDRQAAPAPDLPAPVTPGDGSRHR